MIRRSRFAFAFLLLSVAIPSFPQQQTGNTGSIRGTVIDAKTSQPLNAATVSLQNAQASGGWNSATTAADGTFLFQGLLPGSYRLSASRNGYVSSARGGGPRNGARNPGTTVSLSAGQSLDDVVLRLMPTGVITGHITNERDEPMPGVLVQSMKANFRNGHREFTDARTGFTDDRGEFRIWGLAPGQYYLKAINPRSVERGPTPTQVYVPIFYPGVADPAQAQAIELHPGEELSGINLSLSAFRAVHVRGRVLTSNGTPAKGADVTLSQFAGDGYSLEVESDPAGKFDLTAVPPGSYTIVAQSSDNSMSGHLQMGRANISVGETPVDAPDLVLFPGAIVSGHVRIDGDRKVALPRSFASLKPLYADATATVDSVAVQPDGSFTFHDVPEGEYGLTVSPLPDGYYVRTGRDAASAGILVSHGHAPPAEIRIGPGAVRLQGTVYKDSDNQQVAASVTVALVPDATRRSNGEYYRVATTDQSGAFVLANIPPGDYSLFAMENIDRNAFMDPAFLQRYEGAGKSIHIEEGTNQNLQLQLTADAEDSSH
ncbi:MAG: carboxypeptidase regulatory-like domain-containing protein [Candidatus Sulfotelmatobacter sp.]